MAGSKIVLGKTWGEMTPAEQAAHVIGRNEEWTGYSQEQMMAGQAWLDNRYSPAQQENLFTFAQQDALDRFNAGDLGRGDLGLATTTWSRSVYNTPTTPTPTTPTPTTHTHT